jgi:hypothetical protein
VFAADLGRNTAIGRHWFARGTPLAHDQGMTIYGACAVTFMMIMYAFEKRGRIFVFGFACGCVLSSVYGLISGVWPFGVVELIWSGVALARWRDIAPAHGRMAA